MAKAIIKKITLSEVFGLARASGGIKPKVHLNADESGNFPPTLGMRVIGVVTGYDVGTTTYGEYIKFKGNFAAVNRDGKEYRSPVAILPSPADALTLEAYKEGNGAPVQLGFDIMILPDASDRGYKFEVRPLFEAKESDPLAGMLEAAGKVAALAAPAETADIAQVAEEKPAKKAK